MNPLKAFTTLVAAVVLSGCAATGQYDWGTYEASIERMYLGPDRFDLGGEIERLTAEVEKSTSNQRNVPPGKYAHLGYLYYLAGDKAGAARYLEAEKRAFPESAVLVDGMLERME